MAPLRRRSACRPTVAGERKLLEGEEIEVFSNDDGLYGSWHRATVLKCNGCSRLVEYTDLLCDNQSSKLVERINVVPAIEGGAFSPSKFHRGWVRPCQPHQPLQPEEVTYGQCVDAIVDQCHWEGVVVDHMEGSKERRILFPDLGDEAVIAVNKLRITREWNEVTGRWKCRGSWPFLLVIQKYEEQHALPVSIRQIWYDLRSCPSFEKDINLWIHGSQASWEKAVAVVVRELLSLCNELPALESVSLECSHGEIPKALGKELVHFVGINQELRSKDSMSAPLECDTKYCQGKGSHTHIPIENQLRTTDSKILHTKSGQKCFISPDGVNYSSIKKARRACGAAGRSDFQKYMSCNSSMLSREGVKHAHHSTGWEPVSLSPELLEDGDPLLETFMQGYAVKGTRMMVLRKHLLALGWKIEIKEFRFRYISPQGKTFYSLPTLCGWMLETQQGDCVPCSNIDNNKVVKECEMPICATESNICGGELDLHHAELGPKNLPNAIREYVDFMADYRRNMTVECKKKLQELRSNARKHLEFAGWRCSMCTKNGRSAMWYFGPGKKAKVRSFNSLLTACKTILTEEVKPSDSDKMTSVDPEVGFCETKPKGYITSKRSHNKLVSLLVPNDDIYISSLESSERQKTKRRKTTCQESEGSLLRSTKSEKETHLLSICQRRAKTVLSLLIDKDFVVPRGKLVYKSDTDGSASKKGRVTRDGIKCLCCNEIFSVTNFQAHAGGSSVSPFTNLFLKDGRSLSQCLIELMGANKPKGSSLARMKGDNSCYESDGICSACQDGGQILLCDYCPSSYHPNCVGLETIPEGSWFCPSCRCSFCRQSDYNPDVSHFTEKTMMYCNQCEQQHHVGCIRDNTDQQLDHCPDGTWFCTRKCSEIYLCLQKLVGRSFTTSVKGLTWKILGFHREYLTDDDDSGLQKMAEYYANLCIALDILHECFVPVTEARTQSDLVADIVFNQESELHRLNFRGFYTFLLEKDDELISVANFRIFGTRLAEMPLIGTRAAFRRQGMCRIVMSELENLLSSLGVEKLLLPAVPQLLETWTQSFGFSVMSDSDRLAVAAHAVLCFQGTTMCQKFLNKPSESPSRLQGQICQLECSVNRDKEVNCRIQDLLTADIVDNVNPDSSCLMTSFGKNSCEIQCSQNAMQTVHVTVHDDTMKPMISGQESGSVIESITDVMEDTGALLGCYDDKLADENILLECSNQAKKETDVENDDKAYSIMQDDVLRGDLSVVARPNQSSLPSGTCCEVKRGQERKSVVVDENNKCSTSTGAPRTTLAQLTTDVNDRLAGKSYQRTRSASRSARLKVPL